MGGQYNLLCMGVAFFGGGMVVSPHPPLAHVWWELVATTLFWQCDMPGTFGVVTALAKKIGIVSTVSFFNTVPSLDIRHCVILSSFGVVTSARCPNFSFLQTFWSGRSFCVKNRFYNISELCQMNKTLSNPAADLFEQSLFLLSQRERKRGFKFLSTPSGRFPEPAISGWRVKQGKVS